jgi:glycosidase
MTLLQAKPSHEIRNFTKAERTCIMLAFRPLVLCTLVVLSIVLCYGQAKVSQVAVESRDPFHRPPEWAKKAVWYQIFPERFRNGDPSNDPRPDDLIGSWPHEIAEGWQVSSWTGDWYELQPWERKDGKDFYFHVQQRRYGGDLQGIIDRLDYLKQLGVTAIYLNPIFESPSLHKYDATMYHHVDNNFGPDPEGDRQLWATEDPADPSTWQWSSADKLFLKLIQEAHRRDIKVIIDGVFNHVGMTFWAFEDVKKHQERSKYKDWFIIKRWDDPTTPENEFDYEGWYGVRELPELREDENGLVDGPRQHIRAIVKRWMDPNGDGNPEDGIDGWRLDVAEKVNPNFWREFRKWVREINPQAYLVGEVWWEDWANEKMFNAAPWLQGDMFDAVMNYRWAREAIRFFAGKASKISAAEFRRRLESLLEDYPAENNYGLMNLYDSHDTDRIGSRIVNPDLSYDHHVGVNENRDYDVRKPNAEELQVQKLMALFQMTYVGAPMIYYGTEAGMWGADDPDCRKPMLWPDLQFEEEKSHPFGLPRPHDINAFNHELFQWYADLARLRNGHGALCTGSFQFIVTRDDKDIVAFRRVEGEQQYLVVLNNAWTPQRVTIPVAHQRGRELVDLLSQKKYTVMTNTVTMTLEAKSGVILR